MNSRNKFLFFTLIIFFASRSLSAAASPDAKLVAAMNAGIDPVCPFSYYEQELKYQRVCASVKEALDEGAYVDVLCTRKRSGSADVVRTPLVIACDRPGMDNLVKLLLERHANANLRSPCGDTPLCAATTSNRASIMRILVQHKADINALRDRHKGNTALHYTILLGDYEKTRVLTKAGANVALTIHGSYQNLLDFARKKCPNKDIIPLLEKPIREEVGTVLFSRTIMPSEVIEIIRRYV